MDEAELGAAVAGFEGDLDGGRSGWDLDVGSFPPVGEDDAAGGDELDEVPGAGVAVGVGPADRPADLGVDFGGGGHPADEVLGVGEQLVEQIGGGVDLDGLVDELHAVSRFERRRERWVASAVAARASRWSPQKSSRNARRVASRSGSTR